MDAKELKAKAAAEISMFEKLSKLTAGSMVKMLMSQENKIAEIEKERDVLTAFIIKRMPPIKALSSTYEICKIISDEVDSILEAHNLEQQAKGLTDYAKVQEQGIAAVWMISAASTLLKQAKALKEGK